MLEQQLLPTILFKIVSSDHLSLFVTKDGNLYILALICYSARYLMAKPTCTTTTDDIIHIIENYIIYHYRPSLTYIQIMQLNFIIGN